MKDPGEFKCVKCGMTMFAALKKPGDIKECSSCGHKQPVPEEDVFGHQMGYDLPRPTRLIRFEDETPEYKIRSALKMLIWAILLVTLGIHNLGSQFSITWAVGDVMFVLIFRALYRLGYSRGWLVAGLALTVIHLFYDFFGLIGLAVPFWISLRTVIVLVVLAYLLQLTTRYSELERFRRIAVMGIGFNLAGLIIVVLVSVSVEAALHLNRYMLEFEPMRVMAMALGGLIPMILAQFVSHGIAVYLCVKFRKNIIIPST